MGIKRIIVFLVNIGERGNLGEQPGRRAFFRGSCALGGHFTPHPASMATTVPILPLPISNLLFAFLLPFFFRLLPSIMASSSQQTLGSAEDTNRASAEAAEPRVLVEPKIEEPEELAELADQTVVVEPHQYWDVSTLRRRGLLPNFYPFFHIYFEKM